MDNIIVARDIMFVYFKALLHYPTKFNETMDIIYLYLMITLSKCITEV